MFLPDTIERGYLGLVDSAFARMRQPMPSEAQLKQCKLIAHRGAHENAGVEENTMAAFERAVASGVWGIELDVRWTKDLVPVIAHDADLRRLHKVLLPIGQTTHAELQRRFESIPTLAEVVSRIGGHLHLMIEIKKQARIDSPHQNRILQEILSPLHPGVDYHLICLHPQLLSAYDFAPPSALVAIAYYWPDRLSHWALSNQWGGFCSHYLLMRNSIAHRHRRAGQKVGIGFANSRYSLFREINRGIDWIFSDNAVRLQTLLNTFPSVS